MSEDNGLFSLILGVRYATQCLSDRQYLPIMRQTNASTLKTRSIIVEINLLTFLILAFASYRATRFLIFDTLIAGTRQRLYTFLSNSSLSGLRIKKFLASKILEGISCTWCTGIYVTFGIYWLYNWQSPLNWTRFNFITVAAIAGVQGLIHSYEPGDE